MDFREKYIKNLNIFIEGYRKILVKVIDFGYYILSKCLILIKAFISLFILIYRVLGKLIRKTTIPLHFIWIFIEWLSSRKKKETDNPCFATGAHFFYGKPGAGKSTLVYHLMMDNAHKTGKSAYTTAQMETPRTKLNGAQYYIHQLIDVNEIYVAGEQLLGFDGKRFNMLVYEELLTGHNQRKNKEKSYNDSFIPMIASMGTQRHQGMKLFYFISQLPSTDIQLMLMLKGYHVPKIKWKFDYKGWLNTGKFRFTIKGWKIIHYNILATGNNGYTLQPFKKTFYKCEYPEDMEHFNRYNMANKFNKLKKIETGYHI